MPAKVLIFFVVVFGLYFVLVLVPRRRARVAQHALLEQVEVGDEVLTAGGLIGIVRALDGEIVQLELAEGVVVRLDRRAIAGEVLADEPAPDPPQGSGDELS
jgi:preprotein translocase subunit YajC